MHGEQKATVIAVGVALVECGKCVVGTADLSVVHGAMTSTDRFARSYLVVSHTHWDREWYKSAEQLRFGLIDLIDDLLDAPRQFLLDGQAIVLTDYLAWRPERHEQLAGMVMAGTLEAGPWYVLADNLIPSGEALVRNLLAGRATLGALGGGAPAVLYCPDSFGHPAAGSVLAAGFGLPLAIVWRGYGGRGWPSGDSSRWRSAGGDEVLLHHLPPSGYETGANLPSTLAEARSRWGELAGTLGSRSVSGALLVLNGADHHAVQRELTAALAAGSSAADAPVRPASLSTFGEEQRARLAATALPIVEGELRASPSYVWSLQGTFGTRPAQKRENAQLERLLTREVEPWTALAWWSHHAAAPGGERELWRLALESHPHDTLCGCSIDAVAQAMDDRLRRTACAAQELRRRALDTLSGIDRDDARAAFGEQGRAVRIANPVSRSRSGVVELEVDLPLAPVPVGPGSRDMPARPAPSYSIGERARPMQRLDGVRAIARQDATRHYPRAALVQRERVLVWMDELPPTGVVTLPVVERRTRARAPSTVTADGNVLRSDLLSVGWDTTDGLWIDSAHGRTTDVLGLESVGEQGDLYTHSPIPGTQRTGAFGRARVTLRGPLRAELTLDGRVPVAPRALATAAGEPLVRRGEALRVRARVQLDAGAAWCRILVELDNQAADHRTRLVVRTGVAHARHRADAGFACVWRASRTPEPQVGDVEVVPPTAPLQRYVSLFDHVQGRGVTLYSDGLTEYEAMPDGRIAVTLVRAVGELSRASLPERPGHAGWPADVPLAQSTGVLQCVFGLLPHGLDTSATRDEIERTADDVLLPASGATVAPVVHTPLVRGLVLAGGGLRMLACKRSEDGRSLVARCVNTGPDVAHGMWELEGLAAARLARLDETPVGALPVERDRVRFDVPPHAISTILLVRA